MPFGYAQDIRYYIFKFTFMVEDHEWNSATQNGIEWWALRDSNPRPSRCKRDALAS